MSGPSAWGLGQEQTTPDSKTSACYEMLHMASEAGPCEQCNESSASAKCGEFLE